MTIGEKRRIIHNPASSEFAPGGRAFLPRLKHTFRLNTHTAQNSGETSYRAHYQHPLTGFGIIFGVRCTSAGRGWSELDQSPDARACYFPQVCQVLTNPRMRSDHPTAQRVTKVAGVTNVALKRLGMAAVAEVVRIPGILSAKGIVAACIVETWKERSSTGHLFTRCRIINDPPHLPDGPYEVEFAGHKVPTRKTSGRWELVFFAPELEAGPRAA